MSRRKPPGSSIPPDARSRLAGERLRRKIASTRSGGYAFDADETIGVGILVSGRYEVTRHIGRGAFCEVFEAADRQREGVSVALKFPRNDRRSSERNDLRFRQEARALTLFKSPHTTPVFDFGVLEDGRPFFVMELLRGLSIAGLLARDDQIEPLHAAMIGIDVLHALDEAHARGIVHRDVKPSNVLLVSSTRAPRLYARLIDFGIAKVFDISARGELPLHLTERGPSPCTPQYAAPEQFSNAPEARSDLYALGLLLATVVEGTNPYCGLSNHEVVIAQQSDEPVPFGPRLRASGLYDVLQIACHKSPERRFDNALAMRNALRFARTSLANGIAVPEIRLTEADLDFEGDGTTDPGQVQPL